MRQRRPPGPRAVPEADVVGQARSVHGSGVSPVGEPWPDPASLMKIRGEAGLGRAV